MAYLTKGWTQRGHFFPQNQGTFFDFQKRAREASPHPPPSRLVACLIGKKLFKNIKAINSANPPSKAHINQFTRVLPCSYFFIKVCKCSASIGGKLKKYEMHLITSIKLRTDKILHDAPITRFNLTCKICIQSLSIIPQD